GHQRVHARGPAPGVVLELAAVAFEALDALFAVRHGPFERFDRRLVLARLLLALRQLALELARAGGARRLRFHRAAVERDELLCLLFHAGGQLLRRLRRAPGFRRALLERAVARGQRGLELGDARRELALGLGLPLGAL